MVSLLAGTDCSGSFLSLVNPSPGLLEATRGKGGDSIAPGPGPCPQIQPECMSFGRILKLEQYQPACKETSILHTPQHTSSHPGAACGSLFHGRGLSARRAPSVSQPSVKTRWQVPTVLGIKLYWTTEKECLEEMGGVLLTSELRVLLNQPIS